MNRLIPSFILLLLAGLSMLSCSSSYNTLQAHKDEDQDIGLGGTGMLAGTDNGSGLGGTGIVGEITGFGSIFVNGIEIEYNNETPFSIDGKVISQASTISQLEIGDVVEVLTHDSNSYTQAKKINLRHEVIGKVESVDPHRASFMVLGQTVLLPATNSSLPATGTTVAVAGIRLNEQTIQASSIKSAEASQSLLRTSTDLPFKTQATQWLIQTHMNNNQVTVHLNGTTQVLSATAVNTDNLSADSAIKIIRLKTSAANQLMINQVFEPRNLPQGKRIYPTIRSDNRPINRPAINPADIKRQRPVQMNNNPLMNKGVR